MESQTWAEQIKHDEWDSTVTWKLHYDESEGHAVPLSSVSVFNDDFNGRDTNRKEYSYQPLGKDMSFDLPDYCKQ